MFTALHILPSNCLLLRLIRLRIALFGIGFRVIMNSLVTWNPMALDFTKSFVLVHCSLEYNLFDFRSSLLPAFHLSSLKSLPHPFQLPILKVLEELKLHIFNSRPICLLCYRRN